MADLLQIFGNASPLSPAFMNAFQDDYEQAFTSWRDMITARQATINTTGVTLTNMLLNTGAGADRILAGATTAVMYGRVFYIDPADYTAGSRTTQVRIVAEAYGTESIGLTISLFPVATYGLGAAGQPSFINTLGTVVTSVTYPGATSGLLVGPAVTCPAAGHYVLAATNSGSNNSRCAINARVQVREV